MATLHLSGSEGANSTNILNWLVAGLQDPLESWPDPVDGLYHDLRIPRSYHPTEARFWHQTSESGFENGAEMHILGHFDYVTEDDEVVAIGRELRLATVRTWDEGLPSNNSLTLNPGRFVSLEDVLSAPNAAAHILSAPISTATSTGMAASSSPSDWPTCRSTWSINLKASDFVL